MWAIIRVYHCSFFPTSRHDYRVRGTDHSQNFAIEPSKPRRYPFDRRGAYWTTSANPSSRNSAMVDNIPDAPRSDAGVPRSLGNGRGYSQYRPLKFPIMSGRTTHAVQSTLERKGLAIRGSGVGGTGIGVHNRTFNHSARLVGLLKGAEAGLSGHSLAPILQVRAALQHTLSSDLGR